jgi:hypothetical protein
MRTFQFGDTSTRTNGGVVGQYALHVQCPWRLANDHSVITGSGDLYEPSEENAGPEEPLKQGKSGSFQEKVLRELFKGYDENTKQIVNLTTLLSVEEVHADLDGGFWLSLSGGYRLSVFPSGGEVEAWRLFRPRKDGYETNEKHFVVPLED